ncbi:hypothetical protein DLAC_10288 [Tieghemostelium lacteum]|uniref:Uncharacterized protein n=1 Tax=Tieghemostelium lacteum TaxID=361077 RepID=A0A151Z525_TIELA|nr:hypothetical protein DLAC_10288 [Tieghemostelium lacteum]|eukprot:KYQ89062.1 hypothetical protein DLAC_10288 [Tieghemostelium lacteum]
MDWITGFSNLNTNSNISDFLQKFIIAKPTLLRGSVQDIVEICLKSPPVNNDLLTQGYRYSYNTSYSIQDSYWYSTFVVVFTMYYHSLIDKIEVDLRNRWYIQKQLLDHKQLINSIVNNENSPATTTKNI